MEFWVAQALTGLAGSLLLVAAARVPWGWFVRRLGAALTMYVLFLVWLPLVPQTGDALWDLGFVTLSQTGFFRLIVLSAKLAGMISLVLVMLATTPLPDTFKAACAMGLPRLLVLLMLLAYRYSFLLMEEFARLRIALRVRSFRNRADLHSYLASIYREMGKSKDTEDHLQRAKLLRLKVPQPG